MDNRIDITTRQAAAVLMNLRQRRILLELVQREHSMSQLARATETSMGLLHAHIAKFTRLGLVRVVRKVRRAGRPIKFYRAAARQFYVPAELGGVGPDPAMTQVLRAALHRGLTSDVDGVLFTCERDGPRMRLQRRPGTGRAAELWHELRLSHADARALAEDFKSLLATYQSLSHAKGRRFIAHLALARLPEGSGPRFAAIPPVGCDAEDATRKRATKSSMRVKSIARG